MLGKLLNHREHTGCLQYIRGCDTRLTISDRSLSLAEEETEEEKKEEKEQR